MRTFAISLHWKARLALTVQDFGKYGPASRRLYCEAAVYVPILEESCTAEMEYTKITY